MNSALLKGIIKTHGDTQEGLSDALGISLSNLNAKINGKGTSFRQSEIIAIKERYGLTADEIEQIFFADVLS